MNYYKLKPRNDDINDWFNLNMQFMFHPDYIFVDSVTDTADFIITPQGFSIPKMHLDLLPEGTVTPELLVIPYKVVSTGAIVFPDISLPTSGTVLITPSGIEFEVNNLSIPEGNPDNFTYKLKEEFRLNSGRASTTFVASMVYVRHPDYTFVLDPSTLRNSNTEFSLQGFGYALSDFDRVPCPGPELLTYRDTDGNTREVNIRTADRDLVRSLRLIPDTEEASSSVRWFKLSDRVRRSNANNSYSGFTAQMKAYMLHPDFRIPLTQEEMDNSGIHNYHNNWHIDIKDLVSAELVMPIITYRDTNTSNIAELDLRIVRDNPVIIDGYNYISTYGTEGPTSRLVPCESSAQPEPQPQETVTYGPTKSYTVSFYNDYLGDQIRTRYAFLDRITDGANYLVVDSLFPKLMYKYGMKPQLNTRSIRSSIPSGAVAISPFCASVLNVKQMEIEQLCEILGHTKKSIGITLRKVKRLNKQFVFVGTGGTNVNTAHWLAEMCKMTGVTGLFTSVELYEKDDAELSNLLRFPKDPQTITPRIRPAKSKINIIFDDAQLLSRRDVAASRTYIPDSYEGYPSNLYSFSSEVNADGSIIRDENGHRVPKELRNPDTILYGAPTIQSRDAISKYGNFICATHSDTSASMWLNPIQGDDLNIQVESYGMIQLAPFFMNQLKMAITLIEIIATNELDYQQKDVELLDYSFDGVTQGKTDRNYNWQIAAGTTMTTAEDATT